MRVKGRKHSLTSTGLLHTEKTQAGLSLSMVGGKSVGGSHEKGRERKQLAWPGDRWLVSMMSESKLALWSLQFTLTRNGDSEREGEKEKVREKRQIELLLSREGVFPLFLCKRSHSNWINVWKQIWTEREKRASFNCCSFWQRNQKWCSVNVTES